MPAPSDKPLRKVLLNLYADDAEELERIYGRGWTSEVREIVAKHVKEKRYERTR